MFAHPRDYSPLGWEIRDRLEADEREPTRREGIDYLTLDGPHLQCFSRYGATSIECAPVAWRVAYLVASAQGEPITFELLDYAMSLVVNEHSDVTYMIRHYGGGWYGRR